jgi:hypothetical protein
MITFKDIKKDYPIYILDKANITFTKGTVTAVSFPRMDVMNKNLSNQNFNSGMVVDITISSNGKEATYTIPDSLSTAYAGNLVLATEQSNLVSEVEALKNASEQILASVDRHKEVVTKTTELLTNINPSFKEKQENELRISKMETDISLIKDMIKGLKDSLT